AAKLDDLRQMQRDYPGAGAAPLLKGLLIFLTLTMLLFGGLHRSFAQAEPITPPVEPPVVSLFPKEISNDEIFYIGGRAVTPNAQVLIYIQNLDTGSTVGQTVISEKTGAWFYSFPEFLKPGKDSIWTQLK